MLLVIPEANLLVMDDLLHGRAPGTLRDRAGLDLSGISEMGNILASCFINAMADADHLNVSPEVPEISIDMCLPVIDSVLARFNQPGDSILLTDAVIYGEGLETWSATRCCSWSRSHWRGSWTPGARSAASRAGKLSGGTIWRKRLQSP